MAIKDFDVDIALHYEVAGLTGFGGAGDETAKTGIEMFMQKVPPEEPCDFQKPKTDADDRRPVWVIADSRGILQGLLHVHRNSGFVKDIIVLASDCTPKSYLNYLAARNYCYIVTGSDHIDYKAVSKSNKRYGIDAVMTDTGGVLASVLLEHGLVDELQLLIAPEIVGKKAVNLFRSLNCAVKLELIRSETIKESHVLLSYKIKK